MRNEIKDKRLAVQRYQLYKQAKNDLDGDGSITAMDEFRKTSVFSLVAEFLEDDEARQELDQALLEYDEDQGYQGDTLVGRNVVDMDEKEEGEITREEAGEIIEAYREYKRAVWEADKQVRKMDSIPLQVWSPAAGGYHGFIQGYRQGDTCRVMVYHPLAAEVIGFGYREDRRVAGEVSDATAAIVVEHDSDTRWSGLVFRPVEQVEE